jgi:hypothetical protein
MSDRKLIVRTADQTRRAEIELPQNSTGGEVIQTAVDNWTLPVDGDYTLVNTSTGMVLAPGKPIGDQVKDGDVLEVQPVLVAGA